MTASPQLQLLACAFRAELAVACDPSNPPPVYRPARASAIRLARQLVREFEAMQWREDLRRSVEATAHAPYTPDPVKIGPRYTPDWRG